MVVSSLLMRRHEPHIHFGTSEDMSCVQDSSVDFIITSPPYWDLKDYGHEGQIGQSDYPTYLSRLGNVWTECFRVARDGAVLVIDVANRRRNKTYYPLAHDIPRAMPPGWTFWDDVVWFIPNALPQPNHYMHRLLDNKHEHLLVFIKGSPDTYTFHKPRIRQTESEIARTENKTHEAGRCLGNVLRVPAYRPPNVKERAYHVAAFPEELVAFFVESYTDPGDTVLDPFLGSGTTLKVARCMGRRGVGFELNTDFEPVIRERIAEEWYPPSWETLDTTTGGRGSEGPRRLPARETTESVFDLFDDD